MMAMWRALWGPSKNVLMMWDDLSDLRRGILLFLTAAMKRSYDELSGGGKESMMDISEVLYSP